MLIRVHYQQKRPDGSGGRGRRVGGLVRYLFGPGRSEEHTNARYGVGARMGTRYGRLVAASGGEVLAELQPVETPRGAVDFRHLVRWLEEPARAAGVLRRVHGRHEGPGWVWHASMRVAPQDRYRGLSDETWAHMAREMLRGAGLVVDGDDAGVRWVVVRHAEDHVHVVATLVREDGRREWFRNDYYRCVDATQEVARRMGLRQVGRGKRTAHRRPRPAEVHKAARQGRFATDGGVLTIRDELSRRVRAAAAAASCPEGFVDRLQQQGVQVAFRESDTRPGEHTGVRFALDGDVTAGGRPVWYSGGRLAPDLTWPKLCARWDTATLPGLDAGRFAVDRARVLAEAERIVRRAAAGMRPGGEHDVDGVGQVAADCMTAAAWLLHHGPDGRHVQAAEHLDAATRQPHGRQPTVSGNALRLRVLAQALFTLQLGADDEEERETMRLMYSLSVLAERMARLHEQHDRSEQTVHARAAASKARGGQVMAPRERPSRAREAEVEEDLDPVIYSLLREILPASFWDTAREQLSVG